MYITHSDVIVEGNPVMSIVTIETKREATRIIKALVDSVVNSDLWCEGIEVFYGERQDIDYITGSFNANVRFKYEGKYFCFSYKVENFNKIILDEVPIIAFQLDGRNTQPFMRINME